MENPFKPDDKVLTKIKGAEVEVTVRLIWNNEVQVKCPDGSLRWRTAKTVWFPTPSSETAPGIEPPIATHQPSEPTPVEPLAKPSASPTPTQEPVPSVAAQPASGLATPTLTACSGEVGAKQAKAKRKKRK